ncbi:hypothetical protein KUTeg_012283 [Tegillarca granosa]|uniref:Uncharacterized protein n=1 Tax=Tegillarca granosa TaxID=220873 RepID=A0ABQ9EZ37_TEGGR|nr:hypothetical protein KUTeg_012283 [Tegillarca granosa]
MLKRNVIPYSDNNKHRLLYIKRRMSSLNLTCKSLKIRCIGFKKQNIVQALQNAYTFYTGVKSESIRKV